MSHRHHIAIVAAAATLLSAFPLSGVFAAWTWFLQAALCIAFVVGAAMTVRAARGPLWLQPLVMLGALVLYLTWVFPSGGEFARFLPTAATFQHFAQLFTDAGALIQEEAIPVPDHDGLLLLTTAGVGLVAVLVDFLAVGLRRPALTGLPMLAIYSVPVAVMPSGLSVLAFVVAAAGYLWLLVTDSVDRVRRFGRRFTGEGRDVDLWEPSPLAAAGRRLGFVGVAVAMLVPLFVPGVSSGLLDRFGTVGAGGPGLGNGPVNNSSINLSAYLYGALTRDKEFDMVRVSTNDTQPYYLRFAVADQVNQSGFVPGAPSGGTAVSSGLPDYVPPSLPGVGTQQYRASIEVVNFEMRWAPTYQRLVGVTGLDRAWSFDEQTELVFSRRSSINGKRYELDFVRATYTEAALRQAGEISPQDTAMQRFVTVPPVPQVSARVDELTAGKTTEYDKVRAIYDFFSPRHNFVYSLKAESSMSGKAIVDFLAKREGFCVQYAAAMAWLVRAAGFPARVAFGFTRGRGGGAGVYTLTNWNLHAWTEVYFPQFGWVPFDPTPSAAVVGTVPSVWAPDPTSPTPAPGEDEPGPREASPGPAPGATIGPDVPQAGPIGGPLSANPWWIVGVGAGLLAIALLLAPALRRGALRRGRRSRSGQPIVLDVGGTGSLRPATSDLVVDGARIDAARADAHAAWAELLDTMVDFRVPVDEAETPRATAERVGRLPGLAKADEDHVFLLGSAEERARYARTPVRPDRLDVAVGAIRKALAQRANRWERVSAVLMPRSVLARWRLDLVRWYSRVLSTTGRWRDRLVAAVSPRRLLANRGSR
jgi:transglutaminase-like putative cysteine protease